MSWVDIGGLLSDFRYYDFNRLRVKTLTVGDLHTLSSIVGTRSVLGMIDFIDDHIDQDVNKLLDIDFYYIMFWLKKNSYPDNSMTLTWDCVNWITHAQGKPNSIVQDPDIKALSTPSLNFFGYERSKCGNKNTEIVYKIDTTYSAIPDVKLPIGYAFPKVGTMAQAEFVRDSGEYDGLIEYFRWLDYDDINEAIEMFDWEGDGDQTVARIDQLRTQHDYGIRVKYRLTCNRCGKQYTIDKTPDIFGIFPLIDAKAIMDMQYNIMGQFNTSIDNNTSSQSLLYWHSSYVKDRQKAKEQANNQKGKR